MINEVQVEKGKNSLVLVSRNVLEDKEFIFMSKKDRIYIEYM